MADANIIYEGPSVCLGSCLAWCAYVSFFICHSLTFWTEKPDGESQTNTLKKKVESVVLLLTTFNWLESKILHTDQVVAAAVSVVRIYYQITKSHDINWLFRNYRCME